MAVRRNKTVLAFILITMALCQVLLVNSQILDCARLMMKVAKGVLKTYGQCSKDFLQSLGNGTAEYYRRIDCIMKCVMERVGLLDDVGKVSNETMQVFFDMFIPEDYHQIAHVMVEDCIEDYAPLMDNNDEENDTCLPYGGFVKCVQGVITGAC